MEAVFSSLLGVMEERLPGFCGLGIRAQGDSLYILVMVVLRSSFVLCFCTAVASVLLVYFIVGMRSGQ